MCLNLILFLTETWVYYGSESSSLVTKQHGWLWPGVSRPVPLLCSAQDGHSLVLSCSMQITRARPGPVSGDLWLTAITHCTSSPLSWHHNTTPQTPESIRITRKQSQISNGFAGIKQENALRTVLNFINTNCIHKHWKVRLICDHSLCDPGPPALLGFTWPRDNLMLGHSHSHSHVSNQTDEAQASLHLLLYSYRKEV